MMIATRNNQQTVKRLDISFAIHLDSPNPSGLGDIHSDRHEGITVEGAGAALCHRHIHDTISWTTCEAHHATFSTRTRIDTNELGDSPAVIQVSMTVTADALTDAGLDLDAGRGQISRDVAADLCRHHDAALGYLHWRRVR